MLTVNKFHIHLKNKQPVFRIISTIYIHIHIIYGTKIHILVTLFLHFILDRLTVRLGAKMIKKHTNIFP